MIFRTKKNITQLPFASRVAAQYFGIYQNINERKEENIVKSCEISEAMPCEIFYAMQK